MARFLIKPFDAEAVVFDSASGDTHYLSPLACQLLITSQTPSSFTYQEISKALALEIEPGGEMESRIDEAIQRLQHIGLLGQA
ncbi:MAG: HPr-rel-A system PqqD family peptide chaperone [Thiobacillus sp.]